MFATIFTTFVNKQTYLCFFVYRAYFVLLPLEDIVEKQQIHISLCGEHVLGPPQFQFEEQDANQIVITRDFYWKYQGPPDCKVPCRNSQCIPHIYSVIVAAKHLFK